MRIAFSDPFSGGADRPGALATGNLDLGGTLPYALSPGAGAPIAVAGTVRVSGTLLASPDAAYRPRPGDTLVVVANDGTDPVVGTFAGLPEGAIVVTGPVPTKITYKGGDGNDIALVAVSQPAFSVGAGAGGFPVVNVYDATGGLVRTIVAYDSSFRGGVRVATGDVTGDGVPDTITAPGPGGGPVVRVFDGVTGRMLHEFLAYAANFRGGVNVAVGSLFELARQQVITGAAPAAGRTSRSSSRPSARRRLTSSPTTRTSPAASAWRPGGGRIVGDTLVPGTIVTGAGPGGGPHVHVQRVVEGGARAGSSSRSSRRSAAASTSPARRGRRSW
ncbi:MAG: hypothetical protein U0746_17980 [Gemmataceae bacterium]